MPSSYVFFSVNLAKPHMIITEYMANGSLDNFLKVWTVVRFGNTILFAFFLYYIRIGNLRTDSIKNSCFQFPFKCSILCMHDAILMMS